MKKRLLALILSTALVLSFTGCGKEEKKTALEIQTGATVQEELVQLVHSDLPSIADNRDKAVSVYNAYFKDGAELDSETWKKQLQDEALASYDAYLADLDKLIYNNSEVVNLKSLFAKSANSQRDAIDYVIQAIDEVDTAKLDQAQQSIKDSKTYMSMYEDELKSLCDKYGVTIEGKFQYGTSTDASGTDSE